MLSARAGGPADGPPAAAVGRRPGARGGDAGFTLVELVISIGILGLVFSVLALVMATALQTNQETEERLDETRDEQLVGAYFATDVAGGVDVAAGGAAQCGPGTALVEVRGASFTPGSPPAQTDTRASYVFTTAVVDGVTTGTLTRRFCEGASAPFATPTSTTTVARTLAAVPPAVTCSTAGVVAPCSAATTTLSVRFERLSGGEPFVLSGTRRTTP